MAVRLFTLACFFALLSACADPAYIPVLPEAIDAPVTQQIYVATNRQRNADGYLNANRAFEMTYLDTIVSLPPRREIGDAPIFAAKPNPAKHFVVAREQDLGNLTNFTNVLQSDLSQRPADDRDITVFVHGFYNTYAFTLFRAAQIKKDLDIPGAMINFSWPSAGKPFGYNYDTESMLFARDDLERLLLDLPRARAGKVLLVGHSMGAVLIMETLRQIELTRPGWSARNLKGLALIAPDMPVDLLLRNAEKISNFPQPFVIFSSTQDSALRLSNRVNQSNERVGQLTNPSKLPGLPVLLVDISNFSSKLSNNHMTFAESPALIALWREANHVDLILRQKSNFQIANDAISIELKPDTFGTVER